MQLRRPYKPCRKHLIFDTFKQFAFVCFLSIYSASSLEAQSSFKNFCGTPSGKSEWLDRYQRGEIAVTRTNEILYVPLTIHLVGNDSGGGFGSISEILSALCTLNEDFKASNIQFFVESAFNYIRNSEYYEHDFAAGYEMMQTYNVPNTLNTYFVASPAGNCGYFNGIGVANNYNCSGVNDHTWAHEIGHYLSLPHTFSGWEGYEHNYNNKAPERVNGRQVELVDGTNCQSAGDGFCDTAPDYLNFRWGCKDDGYSATSQKDPTGQIFYSDGSLFMSYSFDACANRFSEDQIGAMRANLMNANNELLLNQSPILPIADSTQIKLRSPLRDEIVNHESFDLIWEPVEGATHYIVEVSRLSSFPSTISQIYFVTADVNQINVQNLPNNRNHFWRVKAFNALNACQLFTAETIPFRTGTVTSAGLTPNFSLYKVFPTLLQKEQTIFIELDLAQTSWLDIKLFDLSGKLLQIETFDGLSENSVLKFQPISVPTGMYIIGLSSLEGTVYERIVIH